MAVLTPAAAALKLTTRRQPAVLVAPVAPTPRETKLVSDIDDQGALRFHMPAIQLYRRREASSSMARDRRDDPVPVIRDAVAMALVHYYPLAGRIRELDGGKLAVDCTGEGVLFVEADADVRVDHFGDHIRPPLPCHEELLFDVPGSSAMLNSPLLLMQVTRLPCGGFVVAVRVHHAMADAQGILQFLQAVAELARGATAAPTVKPVWDRHLLMSRNPPRPSFLHHGCVQIERTQPMSTTSCRRPDAMVVQRFFFFGPREFAAIRAHLPPHLLQKQPTTFEAFTGFIWKHRTMALSPHNAGEEEMRLIFVSSGRHVSGNDGLRIPNGYYGNSSAFTVAIATAGELCGNPASYAG
ncbi:hypothetical protein HU200_061826 [Digitaria exilis]|uniref:Uncharacterized protein n=1 Tax=Digitaria exilis TaxID=1010633 RepID=A0A835A3N0_9POAL|nr:hypothetical protein HU200_061826 [Digitaria exilis]